MKRAKKLLGKTLLALSMALALSMTTSIQLADDMNVMQLATMGTTELAMNSMN